MWACKKVLFSNCIVILHIIVKGLLSADNAGEIFLLRHISLQHQNHFQPYLALSIIGASGIYLHRERYKVFFSHEIIKSIFKVLFKKLLEFIYYRISTFFLLVSSLLKEKCLTWFPWRAFPIKWQYFCCCWTQNKWNITVKCVRPGLLSIFLCVKITVSHKLGSLPFLKMRQHKVLHISLKYIEKLR